MVPRNWPAVENFNATLYSGAFDAMRAFDATRALDALTASTALERALGPHQLMLDHRFEQLAAHQLSSSHLDLAASTALDRNFLDGVAVKKTNLALANVLGATKLHSELSGALNFVTNASKWIELQQSITDFAAGQHVMPWDDIKQLSGTLGLEVSTLQQLSRIHDFDTTLRAIMPEPAGVAWSAHLRGTALPTLSFLAQDWPKALGLMTDLGRPELGVSLAWLTRYRAEPLVMTAAITPQIGSRESFEVVVEDEVVCALCGNPMITFKSDVKWIGPRRGVRQRLIFPACSTCTATEKQQPGFLYESLSALTRPRVIRVVIRGGGQGDRRRRGVLRLVRSDNERDER